LGVERGVVAVTKADAVDEQTIALALEEARELVPGAEALPVSARTGAGLEELREALARAAGEVEPRAAEAAARLHVDRSFTLRGIGTVVTGTLWSGALGEGDELAVEPSGRRVRVRSVQVHDRPVERAAAGQRVAVALPGVERRDVRRGDVLVAPGRYPRSYRLDVRLDELEPIADGARLTVHHGTARVPARVVRIGERWAQLRLAEPVVAVRGDRVVLRDSTTLGGGVVLDPSPPRRAHPERLRLLEAGDPASIVRAVVHEPVAKDELAARGLLDVAALELGLEAVERAGGWYFASGWLAATRADVSTRLRARAERAPLDPGLPLAELLPQEPWAPAILPLLEVERRGSMAYPPGAVPSLGDRAAAAAELERDLAGAGLRATKVDDPELARYLEAQRVLVRLGDGWAIGADGYEVARDVLVQECRHAGRITLARFRDLAGVGRRDAQLLLERFDADGLTRRLGDERVLRRGAAGA
jgi:selenocysteine-specific elongation factor